MVAKQSFKKPIRESIDAVNMPRKRRLRRSEVLKHGWKFQPFAFPGTSHSRVISLLQPRTGRRSSRRIRTTNPSGSILRGKTLIDYNMGPVIRTKSARLVLWRSKNQNHLSLLDKEDQADRQGRSLPLDRHHMEGFASNTVRR